jgi:hypothetical protein
LPLQQSALDAQDAPAFAHWASAHRGIPSLSCLHVSLVSQLPAQQLQSLLQLDVASLQTLPLGMHALPASEPPVGLRQIPTVMPDAMTHVTSPSPGVPLPAPPQHSALVVQRSPSTWQPEAG